MEIINGNFDSFPKEMQDLIVTKRKWISEVENKPTEISPDQRIHCNNCNRDTNHLCLYHQRAQCYLSTTEVFTVTLDSHGYRLWKCAGCDACTLEHYSFEELFDFSEEEDDEDDRRMWQEYVATFPDTLSLYYPKRNKNSIRSKPFKQLSDALSKIYEETVKAFNDEMPMLCAIGIRALIEGICSDQEITGGNLEKKIDGLANILPKNIVVNLHNIRFMGNEAAHELSAPNQEELKLAIEICEDLLNYLYDLDYKANSLKQIRDKKKIEGRDRDSY
ncbi:MAG: DUF4145 domain-containing protein [Anaerolineae bacterium]|nr:DUF4145 domain-containing protein [Anaerolineae bacterium]